jgi:SPFH domain/Band 7 family protein
MGQQSFIRGLIDNLFSRKITPNIEFSDDSIRVHGDDIRVGLFGAIYLNLPPFTAITILSPDGKQIVLEEGGYQRLLPGLYKTQYIDLRRHTKIFSNLSATSLDGFEVLLSFSSEYQVTKPGLIINIDSSLQALFAEIKTAAIKHINSYGIEELIRDSEGSSNFNEGKLEKSILKDIEPNFLNQGFSILNVHVLKLEIDARYLELREGRQRMDKMESSLAGDDTTDAPPPKPKPTPEPK